MSIYLQRAPLSVFSVIELDSQRRTDKTLQDGVVLKGGRRDRAGDDVVLQQLGNE